MNLRTPPAVATTILKFFCASRAGDAVIGDLLEQYQRGRSPLWYWQQVLVIAVLGVAGSVRRRPLLPARPIFGGQGIALILLLCFFTVALLSDAWLVFLLGMVGGVVVGCFKFLLGGKSATSDKSTTPGTFGFHGSEAVVEPVAYHRGISMQHIPVDGAVGLVFVVATVLIFGFGVPAVGEVFAVAGPLGILASGLLVKWHKHHPLRLQTLALREK